MAATGVTAVVLNVTATNPTANSFLTVFPHGPAEAQHLQPQLRRRARRAQPGDSAGRRRRLIIVANRFGSVDVVVDLGGHYSDGSRAGNQYAYIPRHADPALEPPAPTAAALSAPTARACSACSASSPASAQHRRRRWCSNVTVTNPTAGSVLTAYPDGTSLPGASNLNFAAGQTTSNLVVVGVSADGKVDLHNLAGNADVVVDYVGAYALTNPPTVIGMPFVPLAPARLLDTRDVGGPVGAGQTRSLHVAGVGGVPAEATAVVLNVTVADGTADSFLTVFPGGTARPGVSNLNFGAGKIIQNQVVVPVGANGDIDFSNLAGNVDVIADVFGYFSH